MPEVRPPVPTPEVRKEPRLDGLDTLMATPPPQAPQASPEAVGTVARVRGFWSGPRWQRELVIFAVMTAFGLLAMPFLIWYGSGRVLGPYTHGQNLNAGPFALAGDYFVALWHGSAIFWCVALGPAVIVLFIRLFWLLWRHLP